MSQASRSLVLDRFDRSGITLPEGIRCVGREANQQTVKTSYDTFLYKDNGEGDGEAAAADLIDVYLHRCGGTAEEITRMARSDGEALVDSFVLAMLLEGRR